MLAWSSTSYQVLELSYLRPCQQFLAEVSEQRPCDVNEYASAGKHLWRPTSLSPRSRSHSHIDLAPEWVSQHRQAGSLPPSRVLAEPSHNDSIRLP